MQMSEVPCYLRNIAARNLKFEIKKLKLKIAMKSLKRKQHVFIHESLSSLKPPLRMEALGSELQHQIIFYTI